MNTFLLLISLSFRNVCRQWRRSLLTVFAIGLALWSCAVLSSIARGLSWGMAEDSIRTLSGHLQVQHPSYYNDPALEHTYYLSSVDSEIFNDSRVSKVGARLKVPAVIMSERESAGVTLVGINPEEEKGLSFIPEAIARGEFLKSPEDTGIIVGEKLLRSLHTDVGKKIVIMSQSAQNELSERGFRIVGSFSAKLQATEEAYVFIGRGVAQEMLGVPDAVSEISILVKDTQDIEPFSRMLSEKITNLSVLTWEQLTPFVSALIKLQSRFISFLFLLVFICVSFGVINTLLMSVFERVHEIGLIRCLGMKPQSIILQVLLESMFLTVVGAFVGNMLAYGAVVGPLQRGVDISFFAKGAEYLGAGKIIHPLIVRGDWFVINVFVLLMGILSGIYPAAKAASLNPVEAVRLGTK